MSNSLAIAAVTATLQRLLTDNKEGITATLPPDVPNNLSLNHILVTTRPLDKARDPSDNSNQVNIFLYQALPNAALRNMDMPGQVRPGESAVPPVALTLHYLLSAYGKDDNDIVAHVMLGQAMRILHDNSLLDQGFIKESLAGNDLHRQIERVRLTPFVLTVDEISKLWTAFQTQYRVSAAYQADVVLIESRRSSRTPLPVLTRGDADSGIASRPDLIPPYPTITDVQPPNQQASAKLGDVLKISGHHLDGATVSVRFSSQRLATPLIVPAVGTPKEITATLTSDPAKMPAGIYTVAVVVARAGQPDAVTNELPLQVAPVVTTILPLSAAAGDVTFTLTCTPSIRPDQRVSLLFGDREVLARPHPASTTTPKFDVEDAKPGKYFLRLRVDGVDSLLVDRTVKPLRFDPNQMVTIT